MTIASHITYIVIAKWMCFGMREWVRRVCVCLHKHQIMLQCMREGCARSHTWLHNKCIWKSSERPRRRNLSWSCYDVCLWTTRASLIPFGTCHTRSPDIYIYSHSLCKACGPDHHIYASRCGKDDDAFAVRAVLKSIIEIERQPLAITESSSFLCRSTHSTHGRNTDPGIRSYQFVRLRAARLKPVWPDLRPEWDYCILCVPYSKGSRLYICEGGAARRLNPQTALDCWSTGERRGDNIHLNIQVQ